MVYVMLTGVEIRTDALKVVLEMRRTTSNHFECAARLGVPTFLKPTNESGSHATFDSKHFIVLAFILLVLQRIVFVSVVVLLAHGKVLVSVIGFPSLNSSILSRSVALTPVS